MKNKALFISSRPIYPIMGGDQIRTAQQLNFLLQKYDVDVVYLCEKNEREQLRKYVPLVGKINCFQVPKIKCYMQTLRFLINNLPLQVNYYFNTNVNEYISSHLQKYDLVFCNNMRTAEYVRNAQGIRKVLDFVDAISMNYEKAKKEARGLKKIIYSIDYKRCKRYEQLLLESFDSCAIISEIDKQYIENEQRNLCGGKQGGHT